MRSSSNLITSEDRTTSNIVTEPSAIAFLAQRKEHILAGLNELEGVESSLNTLEEEILKSLTPELKHHIQDVLRFLSPNNRSLLVERFGQRALMKFREQSPNILSISIGSAQEQEFYLELQQYLGLIRTSILTQSFSNLQVPCVTQSLPFPNLYVESLLMFKDEVPEDIDIKAREELIERIDYLIKRISTK